MGACHSHAESVYHDDTRPSDVLYEGIELIIWSCPKQPPTSERQWIWIEPNANLLGRLCWGPIGEKKRIEGQSMMIEEIIEIGYGRVGPAFESEEAARSINRSEDENCFALLGANIKFGAQCSSKAERRFVLNALCDIMRHHEENLWSPNDEDELLSGMVATCALQPTPEREAGVIQLNGTLGMFNFSPPSDAVWLQQALTAEEFRADVFAISAASQTGLIGKAVPKHMSPNNGPSNRDLKQLRDASHEAGKAAADSLTNYYAKLGRGIVWQYQRLSDNVACRLFLISRPFQRVLRSSPSTSLALNLPIPTGTVTPPEGDMSDEVKTSVEVASVEDIIYAEAARDPY